MKETEQAETSTKYYFDDDTKSVLIAGINQITETSIEITEDDYQRIIDHRRTGGSVEVTQSKLVFIAPAPSKYHTKKAGKWVLTAAAKKQQLADSKDRRLLELNDMAESVVENLAKISKTPAFERATWDIQRDEAMAWKSDNNTPTPNLDRIAQMRGVPANVLREKAYQKAVAYQALTTTIAGIRQKYEDMIESVTTLDALNDIEFVFNLGEES